MAAIPALRRQRQDDCEFKTNLGWALRFQKSRMPCISLSLPVCLYFQLADRIQALGYCAGALPACYHALYRDGHPLKLEASPNKPFLL